MNRIVVSFLAFAVLPAIGACGGGTPRVATTQEIIPAAASGQVFLAVTAPDIDGRCRQMPGDVPQLRGMIAMDFGDPLERRIQVTLDADGDVLQYQDMRGDIDVREPHDDRTFVQIDFRDRTVTVINRVDGASSLARPAFESSLDDERLDRPRDLIQLVRDRCG